MSRVVSVFEDLGVGVVALITAVLALAVGIVATLYLTGGTPYSQSDLDDATRSYELRSESPDEPAPSLDVPDVASYEADLDAAREKVLRLQRLSDTQEEQLTEAEAEVRELRKALTELLKRQKGEKPGAGGGPGGTGGDDGAGGNGEGPDDSGDGEATEVVVTGTLATTWTLSSEAKPWPGACGVPAKTYQVQVVGKDGKTVATGGITTVEMVKRTDKRGVLTLVCTLGYEAAVPLPLQGSYEFQAVDVDQPGAPLYTALVQGGLVRSGAAPSLAVSYSA